MCLYVQSLRILQVWPVIEAIFSLTDLCRVIALNTRIAKYSIVVLVVFSCLGWCRSARSVASVFFIFDIEIRSVSLVQRCVLIECKAFPILYA